MNETDNPFRRFCTQCGAPLKTGMGFCENCGTAVGPPSGEPDHRTAQMSFNPVGTIPGGSASPPAGETGGGRGKRVLLAIGIFAAVAVVAGIWIAATFNSVAPPVRKPLPSSEEAFPVKPTGIDSINNTVDGKKVAIEGDGHIMSSPGLGVKRPVWALVGPRESVFVAPVRKTAKEGKGTFKPWFQVLVPTLVKLDNDSTEGLAIHLSLQGGDGTVQSMDFRLKPENRWQPLDAAFAYDSAKAPYRLRFDARGFTGAIYIDQATPGK